MSDIQNGPWTILSKKKIYDNPWIDVDHHEVLQPSGQKGIYGTVHFKNLAIAILPLDDEGNTWLVGQHRFPLRQYSWEIPEGGAPQGELPLEAAKRELREETGLTATSWEKILEMHLSNSVTDERAIAFIARGLTEGPSDPEGTEDISLKKVPFDLVYQDVLQGNITDALTVATVLRAKLLMHDL
jgi:8-oxo-dGTP pyrophosphatase MutT (NUDIX family)